MDNDLIRYPGFRHGKCYTYYTMGLDGKAIEVGKPTDLTYTKIADAIFDLKTITDDEKVKATCHGLLIPGIYELPEHYIINNGATILFWKDGTKTIVKRSKDEKFDKRLGFLTAYFQKHCGMSKTKANKFLDNLEVEE